MNNRLYIKKCRKKTLSKGGIQVNKKALRAMLAKEGDTYEKLAEIIGCTTSTVSDKINEKVGNGFTQPEILAIKKHYNLTPLEVDEIFFGQ